ncbi:MAG: preprotein translocase subunit SecY [Bdellovibrionota bacterium]
MVGGVQDAAKIPELRRRVMYTIGMLIVYRIGVFVPTPGIDAAKLKHIFESASSTLFGIVNMFSGGAIENFSVFALGIMPYISVSIIIQLMTTSIKHLEELSKEGDQGRRIITRYTRMGTIVLALVQATMISIGLEHQGVVAEPGGFFRFKAAMTLAAGTAFIMWLGEQITERGIGNGISLIIMSGIVARMPATLIHTFDLISTGEITPFTMLIVLAFGISVVAFIVYVERSQRRIPVQYPRRAVGRHMTQASTQHLPLKINTAGVIPPIFASAFLVFPATIAQFSQIDWLKSAVAWIRPGSWGYEALFALLIIFFTYFYTALVFDPNQIAENLKKNGGFIPTVRPGKDTSDFLNRVLTRLTIWGALYICIVCIVPSMFYLKMGVQGFTYFFGGTAVLIVVGVTIDTFSQIESHIVARNYEGFMNKKPGKVRSTANVRGRLIQR